MRASTTQSVCGVAQQVRIRPAASSCVGQRLGLVRAVDDAAVAQLALARAAGAVAAAVGQADAGADRGRQDGLVARDVEGPLGGVEGDGEGHVAEGDGGQDSRWVRGGTECRIIPRRADLALDCGHVRPRDASRTAVEHPLVQRRADRALARPCAGAVRLARPHGHRGRRGGRFLGQLLRPDHPGRRDARLRGLARPAHGGDRRARPSAAWIARAASPSRRACAQLAAGARASQLLDAILQTPRVGVRRGIALDRLRAALAGALHEPWTTARMAERCLLSPQRFHARLLELTGQSPQAWLRTLRLDEAQRLLRRGLTLEGAAARVGYALGQRAGARDAARSGHGRARAARGPPAPRTEVESLSTNARAARRHDERMKTASWPGIVLALSAAVLWGTTGTSQHFAGAHLSSYLDRRAAPGDRRAVLRGARGGHRARALRRGPPCPDSGAGSCSPARPSPPTTSRSSPACDWRASRWARPSRSAAGRCSPARCRR